MKILTFNHNEFQFDLSIAKDNDTAYSLPYDKIGQLAVSSNIDGLVTMDFTYAENPNNSILQTISETGCEMAVLTLKFEGYDGISTVTKELSLGFSVDSIKLNKNDVGEQVYQVKSVLADTQQLERDVQYYTESNDPILIVKNLVNKSKCKAKFDYSDVNGKSDIKIEYISGSNDRLLSQIEFLLEAASSKKATYFLSYDILERKYKIIKIGKDNFEAKQVLSRKIPLATDFSTDGVSTVLSSVGADKYSSSLSYTLYNNMYFNFFNSKTRKWTREKVSDINTVSEAIVPNNNFEFLFNEQNQQSNEAFSKIDICGTDSSNVIGSRHRDLMMNGDRMLIKMVGDLRIMAGDLILITVESSMAQKYAGTWLISSVSHWFEKEEFTTDLMLCRGFRMKEIGNSTEKKG